MGRIEKLKRQSMCEANKQLLGESMIDKEEVKSLVMKRFGENPPTEEDFEAFENAMTQISYIVKIMFIQFLRNPLQN